MAKTLANLFSRAPLVAVILGCIDPLQYVNAQDPPAELGQVQPALNADDQPPPDGVYLNDSFEADELLKDALESAARHDWRSAMDKLNQVLQEHGHQVVALEPNLYIGISDHVNRQIADWPAEGLDAYRQRYEQTAGDLYRQAAQALDISALSRVYHGFFCTAAATRAGSTLAETHLEAGRFGEAKKIFLQLLDRHPDRAVLESQWRARIAICDALQGNLEAARARLRTPPPSAEEQVLDWRGDRLPAGSILDMIATDAIEPRNPPAMREWPMFGGDATRTGAVRSSVLPTAPLWTFKGFTPSSLSSADGYFQSSSFRSAYNRGKFLVLQPVVADGMVFFKDSFQVWAISLESGSLLWSHTGIAPAGRTGGWGDRAVPSLHGCVVYGSHIYADLGHRPASYYGYQPPTTQSVLVCLDAATGRELWKARPQDYGEDPREVEFEGPAVADESGVYIVARRRKAFGFEDCYLWKFDHSGLFLWRTHLASGPTGGFGYRKPTLAIPSVIDGTVYVQTNLGAIAAVQAFSGQVEWINVYGSSEQGQSGRWQNTASNEIYAWYYNPIYPAPGDLLVSLPLDSEELLILDRRTGRIESRVPRKELSQPHTLLGMVEGRLYTLGEKLVCWDPRSKTTIWSSPLPANALYGRAALSASHIYVPCKDGLYTYLLGASEPTLKPWDHTQQGGNVVALEDCLLIAGNDQITLYGLREDVFARLQQRMDANPFDVGAALSMAEVACRTAFSQSEAGKKHADYVRGEEALIEAIRRAGGFATTWDEQLKARVFRDCLEFARLHLQDTPADLESAIRLLVRAGLCPPDGESLLTQKSTLASAYARQGNYPAEIKQYHQIISDRSLRELAWPATSGSKNTRAIEFCRRKIAELIQEHGRKIYKDIDDKASALLARGVRTNDLKRLDQIIVAMPNSLAAPKALLAKAAISLEQGQPLRAMRGYYAALTRYPNSIDRAQTLKRIADSCLLANRRAAAWRWLTRASREFPDIRMKVGTDTISFLEYRSRIGDIEHLLRPSRPQIAGRLESGYEFELGRRGRLIYPEFPEHQATDWSVLVIYREHEICALDSASGRLLWPEALIVDRKPRLLAALKHVLILADQFQVFGLNPATGELLWHYGDKDPDVDDPAADPEQFPHWRLHRIQDDFVVSSRSDGLIVRLNHRTGRVSWQRQSEHVPSQAMGVGDSVTVFRTVVDGEQVFEVISSEDGSLQRTIHLPMLSPILRILPSLAGSFILVTAESLHAVDPLTGRLEWRTQFDQNFVVHSIQVGLDGIILSPDGLHVSKLSLDDGHQLWRSEALTLGPSNIRLHLDQEELYAVTERRLFSLDVVTGRIMGSSVLKPNMELRQFTLTDQAVVLIGTTFAAEAAFEPWILYAPRPSTMDQVFEGSKPQSLAELSGAMEFYLYDRAIISTSERGLSTWISAPATVD